MLVPSLIDCATLCARRSKCVSFFFNLLESLCQFDGKIYVSFDGGSAGFWSYYELEMTNVAAFKPVTMSSESNPPAHSPHYAVDDKVVKTIWAQECVHTKGELTPWVIIDLEATFDVEYVTLFNRIDEHGDRLRAISVYLGEVSGSFPVLCGGFDGPGEDAQVVHVVCNEPTSARFVKIQLSNSQTFFYPITLCEIRVLTFNA
ncbi:fucolectin-1-like [Crassostrea angulata]|uniref:fucolectin-1-like n=1 Tax=Magallana angulata TaxID=2784310 RepID=UPI0022B1905E|nr:fucolectin-1-like [Crassostrea angulata]